MNRMNMIGTLLLAASTAAVLSVMPTREARAEEWKFSITPYAWATDLGVKAKLDGRQVVDEKIYVGDLLKDIETIFQMRFEATHGALGISTDLFDVNMSDGVSGVALPQGAGSGDFESEIGMTIADVAALYDPKGDHKGLALLGGVRILDERATIDATFRPTPGGSIARTYDTEDTMVDGLIGARFSQRLARHWGYQMQADVSAGGTDYTWSAAPMLSYSFGTLDRFGINAGYRVMQIDFQDDGSLDTGMTLSGFLLGLRVSF
jgi:hypothetical protein